MKRFILLSVAFLSLGWTFETVDSVGDVGDFPSIAVDSATDIYLSYLERGAGGINKIKYATNRSGNWVTEQLISTMTSPEASFADRSSLVLGGSNVYACYHLNSLSSTQSVERLELWYKKVSITTAGTTGIVDEGGKFGTAPQVGNFCSAAFGSGKVHLSYFDESNNQIRFAQGLGTAWTVGVVTPVGQSNGHSSLATGNREIHLAVYDSTEKELRYSSRTFEATAFGGDIMVDDGKGTEADVGQFNSLAIESAPSGDFAHVSYYDAVNDDILYATNRSGEWVVTTVDQGDVSPESAITVANDEVHLLYFRESDSKRILEYAHRSLMSMESGFDVEAVTTLTIDRSASAHADIAVDSSGGVHVAYNHPANADLMYAYLAPAVCGDGSCNGDETSQSCCQDCGTCAAGSGSDDANQQGRQQGEQPRGPLEGVPSEAADTRTVTTVGIDTTGDGGSTPGAVGAAPGVKAKKAVGGGCALLPEETRREK